MSGNRNNAWKRAIAAIGLVAGCTTASVDDAVPSREIASTAQDPFVIPQEGGWTITQGPCLSPGAKTGTISLPPQTVPTAMPICTALQANKAITDSNGKFLDMYVGDNIKKWPGYFVTKKSDGTIVKDMRRTDKLDMPADSPFKQPWCYTKTVHFTPEQIKNPLWMDVTGINYTATLLLNGKKIQTEPIAGPFTIHHLEIADDLHPGGNTVSFEVTPPSRASLSGSWIDWHTGDPCRMMGMNQEPVFRTTGATRITGFLVNTHLSSDNSVAKIDLYVELKTVGGAKAEGTIEIHFAGLTKSAPVNPSGFALFSFIKKDPELWWPKGLGRPALHKLSIAVLARNGEISDRWDREVGLREVKSFLDSSKNREFEINNKPFLVKGAGWSSEVTGYEPMSKKEAKLDYIADMGFNSIRAEGTLESSEFYKLADRKGILILAGFPCCSAWEANEEGSALGMDFGKWTPEKVDLAKSSIEAQLRILREHPSFLGYFNGSDEAPLPFLEDQYIKIYQNVLHSIGMGQILPRASDSMTFRRSTIGYAGTRMDGPYALGPAEYWYLPMMGPDTRGPAVGFNTESGPGTSFSGISDLKKMDPSVEWPMFDDTNHLKYDVLAEHTANSLLHSMRFFYGSLCNRYGCAKSLEEFARKSQLMNYEDHRAEMEACQRNYVRPAGGAPVCTGMIHWMAANAFPSATWNLFSYDLAQGGSYYGMKQAMAPLKLQYSYDDRKIVLMNNTPRSSRGLRGVIKVFDGNSKLFKSYSIEHLSAEGNSGHEVGLRLPEYDRAVVVNLDLYDGSRRLSRNTYWIGKEKSEYDIPHREWYWTPPKSESDYSSLVPLATGNHVQTQIEKVDLASGIVDVKVTNVNATQLSLMNHLIVTNESGPIWPEFWSDNYLTLEPGESTRVSVHVPREKMSNISVKIVE